MTGQEAMRSRRLLTACVKQPQWRVIILFIATAFIQDGAPRDTSLALIWSTKVAADGRGSMFFLYGDPNSYRVYLQRNQTIAETTFVSDVANTSAFIAVETDYARSKLYYSESGGYLTYGPVNDSETTYNAANLPVPAVSNLVTGLSVDWVSNLIYSSDAIYQRICVVDANTYIYWRPIVESGLSSPQDVAVYPQQGFLFWTDTSPKIERLDLATNTRQVLVTSGNLTRPTTLVIDFVSQQLLWLDSAASRIGFVNFDGSGLSFWSLELFSSISSFAIFKGFFFLGDKTQPISYAYNFTNKTFVGYVTAESTSGVIDMTAYAPEKQPPFTSPCSLNNGGCNHFCITKSSTASVCQCAMGYFLNSNGTFCNPVLLKDNFLLVSDRYQYNFFQVDLGNGEVRAASVIPLDLFPITAMDYDPVSKTVYGFDSDKDTIRKVTLADHATSTVLQLQGTEISSLVVDAVGRMLYYVNYNSSTIMRSSLSGDDLRIIVSGDGTLAKAIALDLQNRLLFWSDCGDGRRSIEKAQISNPSSHQSVVTISGICATAIATEFLNQLVFWADDTGRIEQVAYSGSGRLLIGQLSSTSSIKGLAVDSNFVYISDLKQRQIKRINRSTNELSNLTGFRFSYPFAITLFRSAIWNLITTTNLSTSFITPPSASNTPPKDIGSFTTIIVASVVSGAVVLIVIIVTVAIILSKKYRRKSSPQSIPAPSEYDTHIYTSILSEAMRQSLEVGHQNGNSQVQDNGSERHNDPEGGPYESNVHYLDLIRYTQLLTQPQGSQRSTICAPNKIPSDPPPAYEPTEGDASYVHFEESSRGSNT